MSLLCFELFSDIVELYWLLCFLFWQSSFLFSFVFGGKLITLISTFASPISNFRAFSLKIDFYWLPDFNNVRAPLFPDLQFSLYFLRNIVTTRLQQSIIFNLIARYNKNFTIMLKIHIFAIFRRSTDVFYTFVLFYVKIVKPFLFSIYCNILLKYLCISTLLLIFIIFW